MSDQQQLAVIESELNAVRPRFAEALPSAIPTARREEWSCRIVRTIVVSCERNPGLLECSASSRLAAAMSAAVLGIEVDGITGQGYLIPFGSRGRKVAQFIPGYKGLISIGARSGFSIYGKLVREGDIFRQRFGTEVDIYHEPRGDSTLNHKIVGAYSVARALSMPAIATSMTYDELIQTRDASAGWKAKGERSTWGTNFAAMCRKTPIRRIANDVPSQGLQLANLLETLHDLKGQATHLRPDPEGGASVVVGDTPFEKSSERMKDITPEKPEMIVYAKHARVVFDTADAWRDQMLGRINRIASPKELEEFRSKHGAVLLSLKEEHAEHVERVDQAFAARDQVLRESDDVIDGESS